MSLDFLVTELWRVLSRQAPGRSSASQVTVFDSVGFALEDYSALTFIRDTAREHHIGKTIELIPALSDPKNLFGALEVQRERHKQMAFA
jgi:ornithine cyclodeaminase